jgi:oligopeptide transport system substrate-binding protein
MNYTSKIILIFLIAFMGSASSFLFSPLEAAQAIHKQSVEPESLDPHQSRLDEEREVLSDLFVGLVNLDEKSQVSPAIATHWEVSSDGLIYTFHLRPSQWSDGTPLTAEDFVYSFQRLVTPDTLGSLATMMKPIKNAEDLIHGKIKEAPQLGVRALDPHTLEIQLESPTPYFLELLACHWAYPVPKKAIEAHGIQWTRPGNIMVNGPYILTEWLPNHHMKLAKNPKFFGPSPSLEEVVYRPVAPDLALTMFRSGELDMCSFESDKIDWIRKTMPESFRISPGLGVYYLGINTTRPGLSDVKLRQALALAIDREIITEKVKKGGQMPAYKLLMPGIRGRENTPSWYEALSPQERLAKAKVLYAEAEKPEQNTLTILVTPASKNMAVIFASMWRKALGIEVKIEVKEWKTYSTSRQQKNYDIFFGGWTCDFNDPISVLDAYESQASSNLTGYGNIKFDNLLKKANQTLDPQERASLFNQAEALLSEEMPSIPVYYYAFNRLVSPKIKGPTPTLLGIAPSAYLSISSDK